MGKNFILLALHNRVTRFLLISKFDWFQREFLPTFQPEHFGQQNRLCQPPQTLFCFVSKKNLFMLARPLESELEKLIITSF